MNEAATNRGATMTTRYTVAPGERLDTASVDRLINTASNLRFILRGSVPRRDRLRLQHRLDTIEREITKRTGR